MTDTGRDGRVACKLTGTEQLRRRDRWLRLAEVALVSTEATDAGVELHYRSEPAVLAELTELAGLESECCGFAAWTVTEANDTLRLDVETEPTKAPALWAIFDEGPTATAQPRA